MSRWSLEAAAAVRSPVSVLGVEVGVRDLGCFSSRNGREKTSALRCGRWGGTCILQIDRRQELCFSQSPHTCFPATSSHRSHFCPWEPQEHSISLCDGIALQRPKAASMLLPCLLIPGVALVHSRTGSRAILYLPGFPRHC